MTQHILHHNEFHNIWFRLKSVDNDLRAAVLFREVMASKGIDVTKTVSE